MAKQPAVALNPLLAVVEPVLEMEKRVEVAPSAVEEPMAKTVWKFPVVEAAWMESCANGEVVPRPTLPA